MTLALRAEDLTSIEFGNALHSACMEGDHAAFNRLADLYWSPLVAAVAAKYRKPRNDFMVQDAVVRAIMDYKKAPDRYHSVVGLSLFAYLRMAAWRDYLNDQKSESRHTDRTFSYDSVEVGDDEAEQNSYENLLASDEDVELDVLKRNSGVWEKIEALLTDPCDLQCVYAMMDGIRERAVFVEIYSLHHLPPKEQEHVIKKHKDRIKKSLQRRLDREDFRNHD